MTNLNLSGMLNLLRASDIIEQKITGALSSVHGLSAKETFLLLHLSNEPSDKLTRVELSRRLHVSASTVTRMAAPLEKIGLVSREVDERDARLVFVTLTEAGKTRIEEVRATLTHQAELMFQDRWSEKDISQFAGFLERLTAHAPGQIA